jgi:hypothetical protein
LERDENMEGTYEFMDIIKINRCRLLTCHVLLFALVIISLSLVCVSIANKEKVEYIYFKEILENWNLSPIKKFGECEGKPNELNMLRGNSYKGTFAGCDCYDKGYIKIKNNSCGKNNGCKTIPEINPVEYSTWRQKKICVEKMAENYLDLDIQDKASNCPIGKKSCGIIDTQKNYLCVENNIDCPVNNIQITKIKYIDILSKNKIDMGDYNLIYSNTNSSSNIPIELKISESTPCKNPFFYNIPYPVYILDTNIDRQYCYGFIETN